MPTTKPTKAIGIHQSSGLNTRTSVLRRVRMKMVALVMPTLWIIKPKSRASTRSMSRNTLNTGKATAPPPSGVDPATKAPTTMVAG